MNGYKSCQPDTVQLRDHVQGQEQPAVRGCIGQFREDRDYWDKVQYLRRNREGCFGHVNPFGPHGMRRSLVGARVATGLKSSRLEEPRSSRHFDLTSSAFVFDFETRPMKYDQMLAWYAKNKPT
jgi:hypothetical protein